MKHITQSDNVQDNNLMLEQQSKVVFSDMIKIKGWLNQDHQLRFKHLNPKASQWLGTNGDSPNELGMPEMSSIWLWNGFFEKNLKKHK